MTDLTASPIGDCVTVRGLDVRFGEEYEVAAFVPHPLPQSLDISNEVWHEITDAERELGRLDAAASLVPNPTVVTRLATRREAIGTSALEGTFANLTELLAAEELPAAVDGLSVPPNVREVMNYTRAADSAYLWVQDRPITSLMISALQKTIVEGTDSDGPEAGAVRESQVFIGAGRRRISEARFVPPPEGDQLIAMYEAWVAWLSDDEVRRSIPLTARLALAHYQFETIHPYTDGNGRLGRLVAVLQLLREGHLRAPVLSLSTWLKDHASEYRDHLLEVSRSGDWAPWISFFARALGAQARDSHDRIMALLDLKTEIGQRTRDAFPKGRLTVEIADDLIAYPILSVASSHQRHGRTDQANRNAINQLVDLGVLEPYSEERYGRLFWNRRVFQLIDS